MKADETILQYQDHHWPTLVDSMLDDKQQLELTLLEATQPLAVNVLLSSQLSVPSAQTHANSEAHEKLFVSTLEMRQLNVPS